MKYILTIITFFGMLKSNSQVRFFERLNYDNSPSLISSVREINNQYCTIFSYGFNGLNYIGNFNINGKIIDTFYIKLPSNFEKGLNIKDDKLFLWGHWGHLGTIGNTTAYLTVSDTVGNLLFEKNYSFSKPSQFNLSCLTFDNAFYVAGMLRDTSVGQQFDCIFLKIDTLGNILWSTVYPGIYSETPIGIQLTPDSGAVVMLSSGGWPGLNIIRLLKFSKTGQLEWPRVPLGCPLGMEEASMINYDTTDKSFVFMTRAYNDTFYIQKYDSSMIRVWEWKMKYRDQPSSNAYFIHTKGMKTSGGYIFCGEDSTYTGGSIGFVEKFDDDGNLKWKANYTGKYKSNSLNMYELYFRDMQPTSDGGYVLCGGVPDSLGNGVGFLMKIDSLGCLTPDSCETRFYTAISEVAAMEEGILLYPNPANDRIKIQTNRALANNYQLIDLQGRVVASGLLVNKEINITNLTKGIYLLQLSDKERHMITKKIVKE